MKNLLKIASIAILIIIAIKVAFMSAWIIAGVLVAWLLVTMTKKGKVWGQFISTEAMSLVDKTTKLKFKIAQLKAHKELVIEEGGKMMERIDLLKATVSKLEQKIVSYNFKAKESKSKEDPVRAKEYLKLKKQIKSMLAPKIHLINSLENKTKKVRSNVERIEMKIDELENVLAEVKFTKSDIDYKTILSGGINNDSIVDIITEVNAELAGEEFKASLISDINDDDEESSDTDVDEEYEKL